MRDEHQVSELVGRVISEITINDGRDEMIFRCVDGDEFALYHAQDCCESVSIEDIAGDLDDLIGTEILGAEESTNSGGLGWGEGTDGTRQPELGDPGPRDDYTESYTWTFYRFQTIKGSVTIRWYGTSNGYYSESVYFRKL